MRRALPVIQQARSGVARDALLAEPLREAISMSFIQELKAFAFKGNALELAVGVVVGGAFGKIVSALVDDLIMPIVGVLLPGQEWRDFTLTPLKFKVGHLLGAGLDFLIIATVLFLVMHKLLGMLKRGEAPAPTTKACPECLEKIPLEAKRCRACTSVVG
jgi:large conductance mechanosensitive channel